MNMQQFAGGNERSIRRYEYEGSWIIAADVGLLGGEVDVDIVGSTAIVVADISDCVAEAEFELPAGGDTDVAVRDGVLTTILTE